MLYIKSILSNHQKGTMCIHKMSPGDNSIAENPRMSTWRLVFCLKHYSLLMSSIGHYKTYLNVTATVWL